MLVILRLIISRLEMTLDPRVKKMDWELRAYTGETPKVLTRAWDNFFEIQNAQLEDIHELLYDDEYSIQYKEYLENSSNAIVPVLPIKEPDNSLSMGDEHLRTIPEMESDEVIKSNVENLVPIPSESEVISDDTCDVTFCDNSSPLDVLTDHFELFSDFNDDCTSSDDDYFEDIDYVEASLPDYELVSLEEVQDDILLSFPFPIPVEDSDSFFENSDTSLSYSDNSLPKFDTFSDHMEETSGGSTTTHTGNSLLEYDSFLVKIKPDQDELTSVVIDDILENLMYM
nr:hypothetical protein [Tanacetum cinerariifolium]